MTGMIDFLQGELLAKSPSEVILCVNGVGFSLQVPSSAFAALPAEGAQVKILTHLHVREDELSLYGFVRAEERQLFRMLLGVSQIGPAVALRVLGSCSVAQFKRFILDEDADSLKTLVKGIGAKTANRLILEMKDAVQELAVEPGPSAGDQMASDAIRALVMLGESRAAAEKAVLAAMERLGEDVDEERLLQEALLSR